MNGKAIGSRYVLGELLGRGGMGRVYRASLRSGGPDVAIKVLRDDLADLPDVVARFVQERDLVRAVTHPNVVRVHELIVDGDQLGIVMDLVEAGHLRKVLPPPMRPGAAAPLMAQIAQGLAAVHAAGVVHRDLKPENVLVEKLADDGVRLRLTDFGISRLMGKNTTRLTSVIGTPGYMAPEVALGQRASSAADVYALGVMLYEWCTGRPPFQADNPVALLRAHAEDRVPTPIGAPAALVSLLEATLAKNPTARPSATEVAAQLTTLGDTLDGIAPLDVPDDASAETTLVGEPIAADTIAGRGVSEPATVLRALPPVAPAAAGGGLGDLARAPGFQDNPGGRRPPTAAIMAVAAVAVAAVAVAVPLIRQDAGSTAAISASSSPSSASPASPAASASAPRASASSGVPLPVPGAPGAAQPPAGPAQGDPAAPGSSPAASAKAPSAKGGTVVTPGPSGGAAAAVPAPIAQKPGAVASMSVSGGTQTTLDLTWGGSSGATSYRLGWTESGADGRSWRSDDTGYGADRRGVTLINLRPGRTYTVTVTPLNAAGAGPTTSRSGSTDAAPVAEKPGAVASMSVSGGTQTTLDLTWGGSSGATSYRLGWTESGADGRSWRSDDTGYGADRRGVTLINLRPGRTYTVTVTPLNAAGAGPTTSRAGSTSP